MQQHKRFIEKVQKLGSGCWRWKGSLNQHGYGQFFFDGKNGRAHRYAYKYYVGELDPNKTIDHICSKRDCVNPEHLEQVTMRENVLRSDGLTARNSRKTHCLRGHPFSGSNLFVKKRKGRDNERSCRACRKYRQNKSRREKRAALTAYRNEIK